jgi:cobalamin biosynthesis protein CobW
MTVPILLVAGFLGAGKTTLVNQLLREPRGQRIAAIVNDFGAIDVDAALLGQSADGIVSLKNGCICCSLQGDLMRTLATLLRRDPIPDVIVIETSGASDPAQIVRSLLDPAIYAATPLDTVVTVVDARHVVDRPEFCDDPLWRSQLAAADLVVIGKTDLVDTPELERVRALIALQKPSRLIFDAVQGRVPWELLLLQGAYTAVTPDRFESRPAMERFEAITWMAPSSLSLARFQLVIGQLAPRLLRAKGFVTFDHLPDRQLLFQLVGTRATLAPTTVSFEEGIGARLDLVAEIGRLDRNEALRLLDTAIAAGSR